MPEVVKVVPENSRAYPEEDAHGFEANQPLIPSREVLPEGDSEIQSQPWAAQRGTLFKRKKITGRAGLYRLTGTMAQSAHWVRDLKSPIQGPTLRFVDACLRGYSQVFVINNPICGLLILIGILYDSWYTAVASLLAVVSSTGTAVVLGVSWDAVSSGLYGYNGVLTGIALVVFSAGNQHAPGEQPDMLGAVIFMSAVSTVLTSAFGTVTVGLLGMPPTTFPFQVATWLWLLGAQSTFTYFPSAMPFAPQLAVAGGDAAHVFIATDLIQAVFRGVSQVFLVNNTATGVFFLIGLAISSPIASVAAFVGSGVGVLTALALGMDTAAINAGLWGFNSSLTTLCVGGMFYVLSRKTCCLAIFAAVITIVCHAGVGAFLGPVGLPALTFPFTLTTWVFILLGRGTTFAFPVELAALTTPEDQVNRYRVARLTTKAFTDSTQLPLTFLAINKEEDLARVEKQMLPALLCCLAAQGKVHQLRKMARGENAAERLSLADYDGRTPLMLAAAEGRMNVLHYLLKLGVDVTAVDCHGGSALEDAIRAGSLASVRLLVKHSARLSPTSKTLLQAEEMCYAAADGNVTRLQLLLEAGVPVDSKDYDKRTALHLAASNGRTTSVELLLSCGADAETKDRVGNTAKDDAVRHKHDAIIACFNQARPAGQVLQVSLSQKTLTPAPNVSMQDASEWLKVTLLCAAAQNNAIEDLKAMLTVGDTLGEGLLSGNNGDYDQRTALMVACASGKFEAVELLLANGADVNLVDRWGACALWECITHKHEEIASLMLMYGAQVMLPRSKVVSYLCQLVTNNNMHQLEYAVRICSQSMGGWLEDYDMRSPLHLAADEKKADLAKVLASSALFDATSRDRWGRSAVDCGLDVETARRSSESINESETARRSSGTATPTTHAAAQGTDTQATAPPTETETASGRKKRKERRKAKAATVEGSSES
jgi:urea transporter